ncbi:hypothetical protein H6P81_009497 [Aristolochia fimbriata]|uniref:Pullulanase 1, chloroplastic n=1 Tax=Aristolochia fimbriata TaxID=158543 RepID=A0AAV7EPI5_ARIFI|nr:hypothetical protein H6P81_009497 [Aristolochia fimbriata]
MPMSLNPAQSCFHREWSSSLSSTFHCQLPLNCVGKRTSVRLSVKRSLRHCRSKTVGRAMTCGCSSTVPVEAEDSSSTQICPSQDNLFYAKAYWVTGSIIAWKAKSSDKLFYLYASQSGNLCITDDRIEGYDVKIQLELCTVGLPTNVTDKFPHIRGYKAFKIQSLSDVRDLLKCQLAVAAFNVDGKCSTATSLQLPGVLDDLFSYTGPLGAVFSEKCVSLHLWAPTAQVVNALIYLDSSSDKPSESVPLEEINGVWSIVGPRSWEGCYYVYEIFVYHHSTLKIERCLVNDPYARGLSADGKKTFLVDLDSDALKPEGWDKLADEKPDLSSFTDISIYELHIRDFSAFDHIVDPDIRGGYLAFTCQESAGVQHLKELSDAGLTHVHLLPSFQFAGVDDCKENWKSVDFEWLVQLPPDSDEQQAQVVAIQDEDGYNWGYNPVLWGVPKGSYASNPAGPHRILEFRRMVQAFNRIGLRVILDVVYNHLHGSGPLDENSVLDKVVPGYYLRRNADGCIENSTCVNNTASEHFMVERLILDDLRCWAVGYKVDGFRFDLMGHIMRSTMVKAKTALHSLQRDIDRVDGSKIYIYGEGWDFGEVAKNGRGVNASQFNICGTAIGSFNDRIRDAVLGGSPFGHPLQQGFATGLALEANAHDHGSEDVVDDMLSRLKDHIQVGMAANLRDFIFISRKGEAVKGCEVLTHDGLPVAYAVSPEETITYVSAHDNETLFDIVCLKTPFELSVHERCRINHLMTSIVALSQGVPFFHSGDEMLRSKSLDRDSYNSGDWFNRLDFSFESNNWGVGFPPKEKNEMNWSLIKPRLANLSFKPQKSHILAAVQNFKDLLRIRYSSPLFRLKEANGIQERVRFHNTGPSSVPGVIVMSIEDGHEELPGLAQLDNLFCYIVVIVNARPKEVSFTIPSFRAMNFLLHPIQLASSDELVKSSLFEASSGSFTVPSRTTAVFVATRGT